MKNKILLYIPIIGIFHALKLISDGRDVNEHVPLSGFIQGIYITLLLMLCGVL